MSDSEKRSEEIMLAAKEYFRARGMQERSLQNDIKEELDLSEFTTNSMGLSKISPFPITLSTTTTDLPFIESQYLKLRMWMAEASEPCKGELAQILFPVFIHLYIDLFAGAGKQAAKVFYLKHATIFKSTRDYDTMLRNICGHPAENVNEIPAVQNMRKGKFMLRLSDLTVNYLLRFLETSETPSVLQVFNNFIDIEPSDSSENHSFLASAWKNEVKAWPHSAEGNEASSHDLASLDEIIEAASRVKPCMPSVCTYTVYNALNGLTCASVCDEAQYVGCGFEDSVVKIWRLKGQHSVQQRGIDIQQDVMGTNGSLDIEAATVKEESKQHRVISGGEIWNLRGHSSTVYDLAFSANSEHVFTVSDDTTMRLWDLDSGQTVSIYEGHHYPIFCVDVSPKMLYIATGSFDQSMRLWTSESKFPLRLFAGHSASVNTVAFHPNCVFVGSGSSDKSVRMWHVSDAVVARVLLQHTAPVTAISFSPDGRHLASGSVSGEVFIWDLREARVLFQCPHRNSSSISNLAWTRASNQLISAAANGCITSYYINPQREDNMENLGDVHCIGSKNATLVHTSLTNQNYLVSVVVAHGER